MNGMLLAAIGAGLVAIGAAGGIGYLASSTVQSIARQPEASNDMTKAMIIAAAMIEGVALFCALVCLLTLFIK